MFRGRMLLSLNIYQNEHCVRLCLCVYVRVYVLCEKVLIILLLALPYYYLYVIKEGGGWKCSPPAGRSCGSSGSKWGHGDPETSAESAAGPECGASRCPWSDSPYLKHTGTPREVTSCYRLPYSVKDILTCCGERDVRSFPVKDNCTIWKIR